MYDRRQAVIEDKIHVIEDKKTNWKNSALKGFIALLMVMLAFTVISRGAASVSVIQVEVETPAPRKIEHIVEGQGTVEKNRELAVLTQPDILVKTIYVSVGETVRQGDMLALLDPESIEERIEELEHEIQILKLQNEAAGSAAAKEQQGREKEKQRAQEDYNRTMEEQGSLVAQAEEDLRRAQDALAAFEQQQAAPSQEPPADDPATDPQPEDQEETEEQEKPERKNEQDISEGIKDEGVTQGMIPYDQGAPAQEPEATGTDAQAQQDQAEIERAALEEGVRSAHRALEEALRSQEKARTDAARRIEDAGTGGTTDNTSQINGITIEDKLKEQNKLKELKENGGSILAPVDGVVTQMNIVTGQRTTDTAAFTMADITSGMRYVAQIEEEDAKYLAAGEAVSLKAGGKVYADLKVLHMEPDEENGMVTVTILLEQGTLSIGDTATLEAVKQSDTYPLTLPIGAVHSENGKYYVYVLEEEETVLGTQLTTRRVDVTVEEQNGQFAAVTSELLSDSSRVITDSEGYIQAGDRVRLRES
jgi:multidrug efflux pump subunit AcrA (membrane-fusion protein)